MIRRERGVSMAEILVSLCLFGFVLAAIHRMCTDVLGGADLIEAAAEAQESAQIGTELIVRDLRGAGFSPDGTLGNGIRLAAADSVSMASDLNGDGDTDDSNERIGYSFDPEGKRLMRRMGNAPPQPMLNDLSAEGLRFAYFGAGGRELSPGAPELSAPLRRRIRRVDVALSIEIPNPGPRGGEPVRAMQTASAYLRNGGADSREGDE